VWQPQQPTDEWVPRPRINRFSPTVDAVASNFYQLPEVEAMPKPGSQDDPNANTIAEICSDLVDYAVVKEGLKHQQGQQQDKVGLAAQLFVIQGGVFSKLRVRKKKLGQQPQQSMQPNTSVTCPNCDQRTTLQPGQPPPDFCPQCGGPLDSEQGESLQNDLDPETGQPVMREVMENEIACDISGMLFAFPRPGATAMDNSPYMLWAERDTLENIWFEHNFEAQADAIWPDGYSVTYEHALNFWYTGYSNSAIQVKDSCMKLQLFVPPEHVKDFPQGMHTIVCNDKIVAAEPWDYPDHPLTMGCYLQLPTIFFPRSVAFDLVEIQRELNAYESLIKLHGMTSAVDPIVVDANTIVTDITGRSDKVIKWRKITPDSEPPHRMGAGALDEGIYKQRDSLHAEFQNISMAVDAFRGQVEGGATAAAAIQQLRSQAELMFSKPAANWRNFWRDTLRKYVKFLQKYYSFQQLAKILGEDREEEIRAFMACDLDDTVDWVASDHGLPRTRDELRQEMMVLFDKGALDVNDPAVREKIYQLFGETGMAQSFNKDATNARLENNAFKNGATAINPQPLIEDMAVHLYFHKDQAKSQDFKKWPPPAQQALIMHIMQTQQEMQAMIQPPQPQGIEQPRPQLTDGQSTGGQNPAAATPTPVAGAVQ
jgi:hypothetical protein